MSQNLLQISLVDQNLEIVLSSKTWNHRNPDKICRICSIGKKKNIYLSTSHHFSLNVYWKWSNCQKNNSIFSNYRLHHWRYILYFLNLIQLEWPHIYYILLLWNSRFVNFVLNTKALRMYVQQFSDQMMSTWTHLGRFEIQSLPWTSGKSFNLNPLVFWVYILNLKMSLVFWSSHLVHSNICIFF